MKTKTERRGRPRLARDPFPARMLGRVSDDEWALLKSAAESRGQSFTEWALTILRRNAQRQLNHLGDK